MFLQKLKQYTPDKNQLQHAFRYCTGNLYGIYSAERMSDIQKIVREYAPDQRDFWIIFRQLFLQEIIMRGGVPGIGLALLYRAWEETTRNRQSGGPSQLHGQGEKNGERMSTHERERAEMEERVKPLLLAAQTDERERAESAVRMTLMLLAAQTDERERAEREEPMMLPLSAARFKAILKVDAPTKQRFWPDAAIKVLKQSQMSQDCFDHVDSEDK